MVKKGLCLCVLIACAVMCGHAFAVPTIEFSPGGASAGVWSYDGGGTLSFVQDIFVDRGLGSAGDALVGAGARVFIPSLTVTGMPGGPYTVAPLGGADTITIKSGAGITYLTGTLGSADLVPVGTVGVAYTVFQGDITGVTVTAAGQALGSNALNAIKTAGQPLDFELSLQGGPPPGFKAMLDNGLTDSDGFSGAMTIIPAPGAIVLSGIGLCVVGWLRRRRTL